MKHTLNERKTDISPNLLIAIACLLFHLPFFASATYQDANSYSYELNEGNQLMQRLDYTGAYKIYSSIAVKYRAHMSLPEKMECIEAIYGCIESSLYRAKYSEAVYYLTIAEEIISSENLSKSKLHFYYSNFYIVYGDHTGKQSLFNKGFNHAYEALKSALEIKDWELAEKSFGNMINLWYVLDKTNKTNKIMNQAFNTFNNIMPECWQKKYMIFFLRSRQAEYVNDWSMASLFYDSILHTIPGDERYTNKRSHMMIYASRPLYKMNHLTDAISCLDSAIHITKRLGTTSMEYIALFHFKMLYSDIGDSINASKYAKKAMELKDSINCYAVADEIFNLENINQQKELRHQISLARYRNAISKRSLIFSGIIILIISFFLVILIYKSRKLHIRAALLQQLLSERNQKSITLNDNHTDATNCVPIKYEGSNLTDQDKEYIIVRIKKVFNSDLVFSPDFSLSTLAEAVGKSSKAVSQVINEKFNTNFSTLVNRTRIYEACKRIDDPAYSHWSMDGIAESVGYNLRSTFSVNFKKFTGMGVREYRKLSESSKKRILTEQ